MKFGQSSKCIICGDYVPEGRQVCAPCEKDPYRTYNKADYFMKTSVSFKELIKEIFAGLTSKLFLGGM